MIAVIFEVKPAEGRRDEYLNLAAGLRSRLDQIDGFISIERFESLSEPGKVLSLSFFRDEQAVAEVAVKRIEDGGKIAFEFHIDNSADDLGDLAV